jgi:hypothetical protein
VSKRLNQTDCYSFKFKFLNSIRSDPVWSDFGDDVTMTTDSNATTDIKSKFSPFFGIKIETTFVVLICLLFVERCLFILLTFELDFVCLFCVGQKKRGFFLLVFVGSNSAVVLCFTVLQY